MIKIEPVKRQLKELIYTVKEGESLSDISLKFEVSQGQVNSIGKSSVEAGDRVIIDLQKRIYHTVLPGQTLGEIIRHYSIDEATLRANNNISRLFVGQRLLIGLQE
jgi:LysM repeat protein